MDIFLTPGIHNGGGSGGVENIATKGLVGKVRLGTYMLFKQYVSEKRPAKNFVVPG